MTTRRRALTWSMALALAGCAQTPSIKNIDATAPPLSPSVSGLTTASLPTPEPLLPRDDASVDVWQRLRGSFAMPDCDAQTDIMTWAHRYTKNKSSFEQQMAALMPQLDYVQQIAARAGVAGEFALLPWVESQYKPAIGNRNRPSGMWQIMPTTAHSMGLRIDSRYDGRLDVPASADAVMTLLRRYHDDLGDWRLVDYAYNTGEFNVRGMMKSRSAPPQEPAIPRLPVKNVTREHLTRLLAIACVIREPERFQVELPTLPGTKHLEVVDVAKPMPLHQVADDAGMSLDALKQLNSAYRTDATDDQSSLLLLPHDKAEQLRQKMAAALDNGEQASPANALIAGSDDDAVPHLTDNASIASKRSEQASTHDRHRAVTKAKARRTYIVTSHDTLWSIARKHAITVKQLRDWNALASQSLRPGQQIIISAAD